MTNKEALENMHKLFLEALRHREQEIVRYIVILGPALGGFVLLLKSGTDKTDLFVVGTIGILFVLLLGAVYSLALGYNYRYITLELAKLERDLSITDVMLEGWPKHPKDFIDRYKIFSSIPWCTPPEVIKVFWLAFLVAIIGVSATAVIRKPEVIVAAILVPIGEICLVVAWLVYPIWFGGKLRKQCEKELSKWDAPAPPSRVET